MRPVLADAVLRHQPCQEGGLDPAGLFTVAVVVGDLLITLLNHTDRVHGTSLAQLVKVIAPIMTRPNGPAWKQTTFHPFALSSTNAQGQALHLAVESPLFISPQHGEVPSLSAVATHDPETGQVTFLATNCHTAERLRVCLDMTAFGCLGIDQALTHSDHDPLWFATEQDSSTVLPQPLQNTSFHNGCLVKELDPISWSMALKRNR